MKIESQHEAFAYFDGLDAVSATAMVGLWKGRGISTGHPLDGVLENLGWFGKRFRTPLRLAFRFHRLGRTSAARNLFSHLLSCLRARGPIATLQTSRFRCKTGAAMRYDRQPIVDHFRRIDPERVLGVMAMEGDDQHFFFQLERVNDPSSSFSCD